MKPEDSRIPARVVEEQRGLYQVAGEFGELAAEITGQLRHSAIGRAGLPAVGDWVLIGLPAGGRATIHEVLPRKSKFSRKVAGQETIEQIVAANIDTVFLVTSLNADMNLRRIERYLTIVWDSGARPVVLLSKSDLSSDASEAANVVEAVSNVAFGVPVHPLSAATGQGLDQLQTYMKPGETVALMGSSGVGKSTLINRLLGQDVQKVLEIRESDARGRHSTTSRRLFVLAGRGMLIDTPGMRELQLWEAGDGLSQTFPDIETLAEKCRFGNCRHESEPGCAVQGALESGELPGDRFDSFLKLRRELMFLERKHDVVARIEETRRWKRIHKANRDLYRNRDKP
jgi:ribosome biogenesis GTPase